MCVLINASEASETKTRVSCCCMRGWKGNIQRRLSSSGRPCRSMLRRPKGIPKTSKGLSQEFLRWLVLALSFHQHTTVDSRCPAQQTSAKQAHCKTSRDCNFAAARGGVTVFSSQRAGRPCPGWLDFVVASEQGLYSHHPSIRMVFYKTVYSASLIRSFTAPFLESKLRCDHVHLLSPCDFANSPALESPLNLTPFWSVLLFAFYGSAPSA